MAHRESISLRNELLYCITSSLDYLINYFDKLAIVARLLHWPECPQLGYHRLLYLCLGILNMALILAGLVGGQFIEYRLKRVLKLR